METSQTMKTSHFTHIFWGLIKNSNTMINMQELHDMSGGLIKKIRKPSWKSQAIDARPSTTEYASWYTRIMLTLQSICYAWGALYHICCLQCHLWERRNNYLGIHLKLHINKTHAPNKLETFHRTLKLCHIRVSFAKVKKQEIAKKRRIGGKKIHH